MPDEMPEIAHGDHPALLYICACHNYFWNEVEKAIQRKEPWYSRKSIRMAMAFSSRYSVSLGVNRIAIFFCFFGTNRIAILLCHWIKLNEVPVQLPWLHGAVSKLAAG